MVLYNKAFFTKFPCLLSNCHTCYLHVSLATRLGVPSIAGRLLKVIETCVYDLSLQTHTPLHYILGLSSQTLTPAKR